MDGEQVALRYAAASHPGAGRSSTEDAAYAGPHLLVVADGVASMSSPDSASRMAVEELRQHDRLMEASDLAVSLDRSMAGLQETLRELVALDGRWNATATCLTAMLWRDTHAAIAHVGDTRAYMLRGGHFTQLTRDHTYGQYLIDEGRIRPAELGTDSKHSLVFAMGGDTNSRSPDIIAHEGALGDRYLLCSDGVHDIISFETLHYILQDTTRDPQDAVDRIVGTALPVGHWDEFTCIVADVVSQPGASTRPIAFLPCDEVQPRDRPSAPRRWRSWRRTRR